MGRKMIQGMATFTEVLRNRYGQDMKLPWKGAVLNQNV